ncbi:thermonuclease family protein [Methylobacterium radiodurans]|uniref:Nuclease n=1 Tax=Methylobacterium radiodurans TaxID=2202828 RepID=A0A2U8VXJ9_9HYPH|nr:thermonuclease family protein [Methylobacterium radiodurans]AWN38000.1 nuclease [Methylobacterium radiodurans]
MLRLIPFCLLLATPALAAEAVTGHPTVIDGDTIDVRGRRIDLYGIDAPEAAQTCETASGTPYRCGQAAAAALRQQIGSAAVTCEPQGPAAKERLTALCRAGSTDLSAWMVGHGHALALREAAQGYTHQERRAWATRKGIWAGVFEEPADWRHAQSRAKALASAQASD